MTMTVTVTLTLSNAVPLDLLQKRKEKEKKEELERTLQHREDWLDRKNKETRQVLKQKKAEANARNTQREQIELTKKGIQ